MVNSANSVLFVVGDNCNANKKLAKLLKVPLLGCTSHRLNLAVKALFAEHEAVIENINQLTSKLLTVKSAAKLRRTIELQPLKKNDTRWTSTYSMVERFFALLPHLDEFSDDETITELIPTKIKQIVLKALMKKMSDFHETTLELQKASTSVVLVRRLFDGLSSKYPAVESFLAESASIIAKTNIPFETGLCKVVSGNDNLTDAEVAALKPFENSSINASSNGSLSFVESITKKSRLSNYPNLGFIPPSSNLVERFFSQAKLIVTDRRNRLSPFSLEMILYLKFNSSFWTPRLLQTVYNGVQEIEKSERLNSMQKN